MTNLIKSRGRRLLADTSGVVIIEFAFSMPLVLFIALYGMEVGNLALTNLRVSQAALNLADNASRVGLDSGLPTVQLREIDVNDVLEGARKFGHPFKLAENGRITVSSLVNDAGQQRLQWQRCLGLKKGADWDSHYGTTSITSGTSPTQKGTLRPGGMGPPGDPVIAPPDSGVIFVEVNYEYQPMIGLNWISESKSRLHYTASYIVRDKRDFSQIFDPSPKATRYTCNRYTAV